MPPVLLLFVLVVLILAQMFHLVFPRRVGYPRRLVLATCGVLLAELAAERLVPGGPRFGELHPALDLGFVAALQLLANRLVA